MVGQASAWDTARVILHTVPTGERREILRGGDPRILRTGHLVYALGTVLFAVPFDLERLEVRGAPMPVIENVQRGVRGGAGQGGSANYDVSSNGTLVYVPDFLLAAGVPRRLLAVDLSGNSLPLIDDERDFWRPRISPDGTGLAVEVLSPNSASHVWIVDLERRTLNPVGGEGETGYPAWTPDGKSVIHRRGEGGLYRQPADGSEDAQLLLDSPGATLRVMDVSRDGVVAVAKGSPQDDIQTVHLDTGAVSEFLATPAREYMASFSPDGRWLAYTSNESGRDEVYVRPFPRTEGVARLVSIGGGSGPVWAPHGSTLYYRGADGNMMAVPVTLQPTFTSGRPRTLFRFAGVYRMSGTATAYDIHPDGKRFIMVSERNDAAATPRQQVNIVLNWFEELRRLAPATR
jgi:serine/threonine-protein kinase